MPQEQEVTGSALVNSERLISNVQVPPDLMSLCSQRSWCKDSHVTSTSLILGFHLWWCQLSAAAGFMELGSSECHWDSITGIASLLIVLLSWKAQMSLAGTGTITDPRGMQTQLPLSHTESCSHCIPVAAAIRNKKSDLSGAWPSCPSSAFPFCGVLWPQILNSRAGIFWFHPRSGQSLTVWRHQWTFSLVFLTLFSFAWHASLEASLKSVCTWNKWSKF